ncbi:MAG: tRNA pseudouridine(13) synthase TruD [Leptolyngbya sp. PLA3]|nr:MAG: tRNA pseudouridine(13) synthase TruD [Cyanobacteria bacterium CYA]MCE7967407.1 tRNA pseudouridine(13) synthase TruD [Leptolyngbya sp. PL-A3]
MSAPLPRRGQPVEHDHFAHPRTWLTGDVPGIGGIIRQRPEDFVVEEVPLRPPAGHGEHFLLFVQKADLTTEQVAHVLCSHFDVPRHAVGFAGQKDRVAVTRQCFSVHAPGRRLEDFGMIEHEHISVLWADRHDCKLRRGDLAGNRFVIRIRGVDPTTAPRAARCLRILEKLGVPNRFGIQRFGVRHRNHMVGREVFRGRAQPAIEAMLAPGGPDPHADAWNHFARGEYKHAAAVLPGSFRVERLVLGELARGRTPEQALARVPLSDQGFYVSAFQSAVFNLVLERRLAGGVFSQSLPGDLLTREDGSEPTLLGEQPDAALIERVHACELTASGPLWGVRMPRAGGQVARAEEEALHAFGMSPEDLDPADKAGILMAGGTRRALRVRLRSPDVEGGLDEHGAYVRCAFDLPRGAFATEVLREIMKTTVEEETDA